MKVERTFQELFDDAPIGYYEYDTQGRVVNVNRTHLAMLGYSRDEIMGQPVWQFVVEKEAAHQLVLSKLAGKEPPSRGLERMFQRKNGTTFPGLIEDRVLHDSDGKVIGVRCTMQDISELKRAQKALEESEEASKRLAQENFIMAEIGRIIGSTLNIEEVYEGFARELSKLVSFDQISISIVNLRNNTVCITYVSGLDLPGRRPGDCLDLAGKAAEECVRTRASLLVVVENEEEVVRRFPGLLPTIRSGIRSTILTPLISKDEVTGVFHIRSTRLNAYAERDLRIAERVGHQIAGAIANAQIFAELERAEGRVMASLREKEALLKEIHHRVKNNLQIISSLLSLQARGVRDPHSLELFRESQDRVRSMALVHEKLYLSEDLGKIDFSEYVRSLVGNLFSAYQVGIGRIGLKIRVKGVFLSIDTAIPVGLIINELVTNSLKHAFPVDREGEISISLSLIEDTRFILQVKDDGVGFPGDLNVRTTESLGLQLVNILISQLQGTIELDRNRGAEFRITFSG